MLAALQQGDCRAADELLAVVYGELRRMAGQKMASEPLGHTLQPTALVHEAWLRMVGEGNPRFDGRAHFFAVAAEAMRRILVEAARRKRALKRGGGAERLELQESQLGEPVASDQMMAIDEALDQLAAVDRTAADLVKLRYFVGMTMEEAAGALNLSLRGAERLWTYARAWLRRELTSGRS
jgi:RNA polymerase sigma factor (TIGR02999 family)